MRLSLPDTTENCINYVVALLIGTLSTFTQCYQWWKAKTLPYEHAITAYGTAIAGLPSQIAYGSWQKNLPWYHHLTTLLAQYTMLNFNNNHNQTLTRITTTIAFK